MTTAFAALLIGVAAAALLLALGAYLWVNRTPPANERFDEYGRVPLFGVDLTGSAPPPSTPRGTQAIRERDVHDLVPLSMHERRPEASVDVPADARIDFSAEHRVEAPVESRSYSAVSPPFDPPASAPAKSDRRTGERALVATELPGWAGAADSGTAPTPKYVPSVSATPPTEHFADTDIRLAGAQASSTGTPETHVYGDGVPGHMVEGHRLRYSTPVEGTLQFLPGRLEINSGLDTGREIRFVSVPGPNGIQVTFGRTEGPLYRHIQLRDQTVSREHARMTLLEGRWVLTNLSRTNPVAHNGRVLAWSEQQPLDDGDRVEMGEVIFNFRSR